MMIAWFVYSAVVSNGRNLQMNAIIIGPVGPSNRTPRSEVWIHGAGHLLGVEEEGVLVVVHVPALRVREVVELSAHHLLIARGLPGQLLRVLQLLRAVLRVLR